MYQFDVSFQGTRGRAAQARGLDEDQRFKMVSSWESVSISGEL